ncbi:MAG: hypothetical protein AABW54_02245 [Candidatus Micrarchaeota archaeon]
MARIILTNFHPDERSARLLARRVARALQRWGQDVSIALLPERHSNLAMVRRCADNAFANGLTQSPFKPNYTETRAAFEFYSRLVEANSGAHVVSLDNVYEEYFKERGVTLPRDPRRWVVGNHEHAHVQYAAAHFRDFDQLVQPFVRGKSLGILHSIEIPAVYSPHALKVRRLHEQGMRNLWAHALMDDRTARCLEDYLRGEVNLKKTRERGWMNATVMRKVCEAILQSTGQLRA